MGLLFLLWMMRLSEASGVSTARRMKKLILSIRRGVFMFVHSPNSRSGVAASHADSVLRPWGCREGGWPSFLFLFLLLSSGCHSLSSLAAQHLLGSGPFQTFPAGVCAGEESELEPVGMWGLSSCWGSPPSRPLFPPLCVPAALWAFGLSAGGSRGKIYVLGFGPFTGCKSRGGWFLSGGLFPSVGGFFFKLFLCIPESHYCRVSVVALKWNPKFWCKETIGWCRRLNSAKYTCRMKCVRRQLK